MKQPNNRKMRENTAFLYSRLSRDDNVDGDSYSIQNQKKLLTKVAKDKGYTNLVHYYDDGISGVTMDRPGFKKMMAELEKGKAAAVFFKDMSRLGRNYIEVGRLCEEFFPENDIRYVAISDNVDSDDGDDELTPIRNLFNEWYSRDISKKKRISNNIRGNSGIPLGLPPYGYMKDPDNTNHWLVEPEAAAVVRRIFEMKIEGLGSDQIANALTEDKILTPTEYWRKRGIGRPVHRRNANPDANPYKWSNTTIHGFLRKQEYCGDVLNFKTHSKSYKNKKRLDNDRDDWVIFKDVHEPIICREIFEKIQRNHKQGRSRKTSDGERNMFSGLLRCVDCGRNLHYHFNQKNHDIKFFSCPNNNKVRKTCDTTHYIRVDFLDQIVLAEIRRLARFVRDNEDSFLHMVEHNMNTEGLDKSKFKEKELATLTARDKELDVLFEQIYEDNVSGKLSDSRFGKLSVSYENEQKTIGKRIDDIQDELEHEANMAESIDWFVGAIKKHTRIRKLTDYILRELIESIDIYHAEKVNGITSQQITIYFNCIGAITLPDMERRNEPAISLKTRKGVELNYAFA